jgi:hypothetical protein
VGPFNRVYSKGNEIEGLNSDFNIEALSFQLVSVMSDVDFNNHNKWGVQTIITQQTASLILR